MNQSSPSNDGWEETYSKSVVSLDQIVVLHLLARGGVVNCPLASLSFRIGFIRDIIKPTSCHCCK